MTFAFSPVEKLAHAKLNLRLEVGPKSGSHHRILSVVTSLGLADQVLVQPGTRGITIECHGADMPAQDNLAWRAAHALAPEIPLRITVRKQIPTQAGLGGGSADAAAALLALAEVLGSQGQAPAFERLVGQAGKLGSDVPSALFGGLKIVAGAGELVTPYAAAAPPWGIVLLKPPVGSPTSNAYALLDHVAPRRELSVAALEAAQAMCSAYAAHDLKSFLSLLHNDFSAPIEQALPEVAHARARLSSAGAAATLLCGSGSCVAGFFADVAAAREGLARLAAGPADWAATTSFAHD